MTNLQGRTEVIALLQKSNAKLEGVNIKLNEELGRGSYAAVYQAEWKGLSCVAKVFHPVLFPRWPTNTWKQLAREIDLLQNIRHPNIVQLLGFIETSSGIPSIIMERLDTNLTKLIEQHHSLLSVDSQVCILHDVAVGLNFLHSQNEPIIHRDLSSNNILITDHLVAKISDLGLAKHVKFTHQQDGSSAGFGTQDYMPPEVLGQKPPQISPKTDVFSFGVVMLHVVTGRPPDVTGRIFADAEKDRRKHHLILLRENSLFHPLVLKCLSECSNRPTATELCETFKRFGVARKSNVKLFKSFQEEFTKQVVLVAEIKLTKEIGVGVFGKVFLAEYLGSHCVAKELNSSILSILEVNNEETQMVKDRVLRKCHRILQLRHSNIVQFIGVYYMPGPRKFPLLMMEMVDISLSLLLKDYPNIPIDSKLTILLDMSLGLKFLHCQKPSVVHCNLSSQTVLLTQSLQAKISDVEMALIVPESSLKSYLKLTCFTAPELSKPSTTTRVSNPSADVYSYGMITLHTITQKWPEANKQPNSRTSQYQSYIDKISSDNKELGILVVNCLDDVPSKRPVIDEVSEKMKKLVEKYPATVKNSIAWQTELQQVKEQNEDKDNQITKLTSDLKSREEEIEQLKYNADIKTTKLEESEKQIKTLDENLAEQNAKIQRLEITIEEMKDSKQAADIEHQQTLDQHKIKVAKTEEEKKQLQYTIRAQDENLDEMKNAIKQSEESKKTITKENQRLLKDLKDSHTHKDNLEKRIEELKAIIGKQKSQVDQIRQIVADDFQDNVTNHTEDKAEQTHKQKDKIIQQSDEKIAKLEQECQQKDETIQRNDEEIQEKNKIIKEKDLEIESVHKQYYEVENQLKELKLQKENGRAKSELNYAETPKNLHNTGVQMTGNELNGEVNEKFQQEGKEKLNNNQHISGKGEQINIVKAKDTSNNRDVKGENKNYRIKPVRSADKQLEHKVKRIAVPLCSVDNLTHHVIANVPASALVTLKNHLGKPMNNCGDTISVKIQSNKYGHAITLPFNITERGNGQYDVSYTISEASDYRLHILVNDQNIVNPPHRICCLHYPHQASENGSQMRIIKPLQNTTGTSCYFTSVLQVLNQTNGFIEMMLKYAKNQKRNYLLPYHNDNDGVNIEMPIDLHGVIQDSLLYAIMYFLKSVECDTDQVIKPDYVLHRLTENSKQQRFGQHTQEDSHELLRYLLYELKKEEIDLIKDGVYEYFGVNSEYSSNPDVDNQTKLILKSLLHTVTKMTTPIDEVFGGVKLNTVICRECQTPSQTLEPFFDLSLGIPDAMKCATYSSSFSRGYAKGNSNIQQQPPVGRSAHYNHTAHSHHHTDNTTIGHPYPTQTYWGQHGKSNTFSGKQQGGAEVPIIYDNKTVRDLLKSKKMFYQPASDELTSVIDAMDDVQISLADHTDIDNMDEENKFVCKICSADTGTATDASGDEICLCLVTKQILIHQLPQSLIIHFKRFNNGAFSVTKESKHVTFLPILNMAPYCNNKCLEKFGDAKGEILYGLYGVVEHKGLTLQSGHYIAYVRRRPERQQKFASRPANNKTWIYDGNAAQDGKWFYTSDLTVRECLLGFEVVKGCKAYMLFYELLPWMNYENDM